ncbi:PLD nuclease N-terminal domain-containing protein [Hymenobacter arizonensis]|uniref:Phospholipase_D-nuclease N-terminal n=1 Tax=Hymenobacter arizonensis TaxID=1227077 RepID=A0A1I5XBI5_HYMAR|nr:PLD nuclease N-terminal domain-containing protein [Hymenobacter arizonensis]SFQ29343.1 Phospholipase_D-nuclease N-terminal [Hymenobacter arizonensis]
MRFLTSLSNRIPSLALLLSLFTSVLLTACGSGRRDDGTLSIVGIVYLLFAVFAFLSLIKQDWSIGKKIIWGLIIWFFPFGGSIIYFLFSGRK